MNIWMSDWRELGSCCAALHDIAGLIELASDYGDTGDAVPVN
ncbi:MULTISPECIES: hypothetical protein [Methylomicrobium]|uniref:Uncharacterized protein n=1 Tax=Methylomicrobium album BG8 TaxID=686340 RepID=H8GJ81_METAL|nr:MULTISPECIES: hypothetical protein [Methylomicrobium]EIC27898.1 hypothetical protein Metal_0027 [Methylomicrobium album BG8]